MSVYIYINICKCVYISTYAYVLVFICGCIRMNTHTYCISSVLVGSLCQDGISSVRNSVGQTFVKDKGEKEEEWAKENLQAAMVV